MVGLTGKESSRLCNPQGIKTNHYPSLLLTVLRQNVFGKGVTVRSIRGGELVGFSQLYEVHHNFTRRRIQQASQGTQVISPPLPPYGVVSSLVVGPLWSMEYEGYAGSLGLSRDWEWRCIKK